ncbi:hypothetical protein DFR68_106280 [Nocardia mexicana]|uniref:Uncharacterized protein n=2 Tax=Nocardia mexicana TaxID=279262 RepID=A0A370H1K3_9NOCA|nr:hypothetical protein DFR68_106280 [Nocardia mexicana]
MVEVHHLLALLDEVRAVSTLEAAQAVRRKVEAVELDLDRSAEHGTTVGNLFDRLDRMSRTAEAEQRRRRSERAGFEQRLRRVSSLIHAGLSGPQFDTVERELRALLRDLEQAGHRDDIHLLAEMELRTVEQQREAEQTRRRQQAREVAQERWLWLDIEGPGLER